MHDKAQVHEKAVGEEILSARGISHEYETDEGALKVLDDVSFQLNRGEFLSIVGPTGCGKTTLLDIIGGLNEPTEGDILLYGEPIPGPQEEMEYVFQDDASFPWLTVMENVEFGLEVKGVPKQERQEKSQEMIDLVGIDGFEDSYPHELSGGMKQRMLIARTLAMQPEILLMDEPFGALDEQTRNKLGQEVIQIIKDLDRTAILVTHSLMEAVYLSDKIILLSSIPGRVKERVEIDVKRPREIGSEELNEYHSVLWDNLKGAI